MPFLQAVGEGYLVVVHTWMEGAVRELTMDDFNRVVARAKEMALEAQDHQEEKPCIDCKGAYHEAYTHCRAMCPAYQRWLNE
jgi:hypothetical protein